MNLIQTQKKFFVIFKKNNQIDENIDIEFKSDNKFILLEEYICKFIDECEDYYPTGIEIMDNINKLYND